MTANSLHSDTAWDECEAIIKRFEQDWQNQNRPDLQQYVCQVPGNRVRLLFELIHIDLEFRFRVGEVPTVAEYLNHFPELSKRDPQIVDLIAAEISLRRRYGQAIIPQQYHHLYPDLTAVLDSILLDSQASMISPTLFPQSSIASSFVQFHPLITGYEIETELGKGGMGIVFRAYQPALNRLVAIKTLTLGLLPSPSDCEQFAREARAMAELNHPHLVPIYQVGEWTTPNGIRMPYFVMKYYGGGSLNCSTIRDRWNYTTIAHTVETIAEAVHHAHQRGILHRDLKPSNIFLDEQDRPHVADFGLASRFDPDRPASLTETVVGTPAYMAPEQAQTPSQVTTAADVYGVGAILYYLLTDRPPFRAETPLATLDLVTKQLPTRPREIKPQIPKDLEIICLKCLEKDPARRYASAAALAQDLRAWQQGLPIQARSTPVWEHLARWIYRHPVTAVLLFLIVGILFSSIVILANRNEQIRLREGQIVDMLLRERQARHELGLSLQREQSQLYLDRIASVGRLWNNNTQLGIAWEILDRCQPWLRQWEWYYLDSLRQNQPIRLTSRNNWVAAASFRANGQLVTAEQGDTIHIWDPPKTQPSKTWQTKRLVTQGMALHPRSNWVATVDRLGIALWDLETTQMLRELDGQNWVAVSADGLWLASTKDNLVRIWETATWQLKYEWAGHTKWVRAGTFSPDGRWLATAGTDQTVRLWDLTKGGADPISWARPNLPSILAFSADAQTLVEVCTGVIGLTDIQTGRSRDRINVTDFNHAIAVSTKPNNLLAHCGPNGEIRLWNFTRNATERVFHDQAIMITALALSLDHRWLVSAAYDKSLYLWDLHNKTEVQTLAEVGIWIGGLSIAPNGNSVAVATRFRADATGREEVRIFDLSTGKLRRSLKGIGDVAFTNDSKKILTGLHGGGVVLWDIETGRAVRTWTMSDKHVYTLTLTADGQRFAVGTTRGEVLVFDLQTGTELGRLETLRGRIDALAFSPDGKHLAVARRNEVMVCNSQSLQEIYQITLALGVQTLQYSPDGSLLVTADRDRVVRLRDAKTGKTVHTLQGTPARIDSLAFNSEGNRIITAGADRTVRIWDVDTGVELLSLPGVTDLVSHVGWNPVRNQIIAVDKAIRIWEAPAKPKQEPKIP